MKHRQFEKTLCPYYKHEDPQVIYCTGIVDNSSIHVAFGNRTDSYNHKKEKCRTRNYRSCEVYKMLEKIYDA